MYAKWLKDTEELYQLGTESESVGLFRKCVTKTLYKSVWQSSSRSNNDGDGFLRRPPTAGQILDTIQLQAMADKATPKVAMRTRILIRNIRIWGGGQPGSQQGVEINRAGSNLFIRQTKAATNKIISLNSTNTQIYQYPSPSHNHSPILHCGLTCQPFPSTRPRPHYFRILIPTFKYKSHSIALFINIMIHQPINHFARKNINSPRLQRVISPQRFPQTHSNIPPANTRSIAPQQLNHTVVCSPRRLSNYSHIAQSTNPYRLHSPNSQGIYNTGFSSVKRTIGSSLNKHSPIKNAQFESAGIAHNLNTLRSIPDMHEATIIQAINTTRRTSLLNPTETEAINNKNDALIRMLPTAHSLTEQTKEVSSEVLANQFKSTLEQVEKRKTQKQSQGEFQKVGQGIVVEDREGNSNQQYIVQLLEESKKTKQMIEKLMRDNQMLAGQNRRLLEQSKFFRSQNVGLRQQIDALSFKQFENRTHSNKDFQDQQLTISILQQQVQLLKSTIENNNMSGLEDINRIINSKDVQIRNLQAQNADLTIRVKELLAELQSFQERFNNERMLLIEENQYFRNAATQQIQRLNSLLQSGMTGSTNVVRYTEDGQYEQSGRVQYESHYKSQSSPDTRIRISGGYQELVLGKRPSPARIIDTTVEVVEGVAVSSYLEQIRAY